jgi:hypothetical protein
MKEHTWPFTAPVTEGSTSARHPRLRREAAYHYAATVLAPLSTREPFLNT